MATIFNSGVYRITHEPSATVYIGSSKNIASRFYHHKREMVAGKHVNPRMQNVFNAYGIDGFCFEPLVACSAHELQSREQWWIDYYRESYGWGKMFNCEPLAYSRSGRNISPETRERMAVAKRGRPGNHTTPHTEEAKSKMSQSHRRRFDSGWKMSDESRERLSMARIGNKNALGNRQSEETKMKRAISIRATCARRKAEKA